MVVDGVSRIVGPTRAAPPAAPRSPPKRVVPAAPAVPAAPVPVRAIRPAPRHYAPVRPPPAPRHYAPIRPAPVPVPVHRPVARQVPHVRRVIPVRAAPAAPAPQIIDPAIWGPPLWRLLHGLAALRETDTMWSTLLSVLRQSLPCPDCTHHYTEWWTGHPVGGDGVARWLIALHNDVNVRRGVAAWSPDAVSAVYGDGRVTIADLRSALHQIRGKVGEQACQMLAGMIDRCT